MKKVIITPPEAEYLVKADILHKIRQSFKNADPGKVQAYAELMRSGQWDLRDVASPVTLCDPRSHFPRLIADGAHRIRSVIEAGQPVELQMSFYGILRAEGRYREEIRLLEKRLRDFDFIDIVVAK